jgi:hypothetical protein
LGASEKLQPEISRGFVDSQFMLDFPSNVHDHQAHFVKNENYISEWEPLAVSQTFPKLDSKHWGINGLGFLWHDRLL